MTKRALPAAPVSATDARYRRAPQGRRRGPVLTTSELWTARYALVELILRRTRCGEPVSADLGHVLTRLTDLLVIGSASADGTTTAESDTSTGQLGDLIDAVEAALILGCTPKWVRCLAEELGGQKVSGRWFFPAPT